MSSTLSIATREDILVEPQLDDAEPESLQVLFSLLRATSADVAQTASSDWGSFVESCIYVAYVSKLVPAVAEGTDAPTGPRVSKYGWGTIQKHWVAPVRSLRHIGRAALISASFYQTSLQPQKKQTPEEEETAEEEKALRQHVLDALRSRVVAIPADEQNPGLVALREGGGHFGALAQYASLVVRHDLGSTVPYHVFLSDRLLLFVTEEGGIHHISPTATSTSPLKIKDVIQLSDISGSSRTFTEYNGQSAVGLELSVRSATGSELVTLIFPDEQQLTAWTASLRQLQFVLSAPDAFLGLRPLDDGFSHLIELQSRAMSSLEARTSPGALYKYATVAVASGFSSCQLGAYLCERGIAFVYNDPRKKDSSPFNLKTYIDLDNIRSVEQESEDTIRLNVEEEPGKQSLYVFTLEHPARPLDWLLRLRGQCQFLLPTKARFAESAQEKDPWHRAHPDAPKPSEPTWCLAGVATLGPCPTSDNEYTLSVAVLPAFESDGIATHGVANALSVAFDTLGAHRVQSRILHASKPELQPRTARAIRKFVHLGFTHEGIQRHAVMHPRDKMWADTSVMAMLDSDWLIRESVRAPSATLWDEMFARHQREREALLRWDGSGGLKRSKSTETVREAAAAAPERSNPVTDSAATKEETAKWPFEPETMAMSPLFATGRADGPSTASDAHSIVSDAPVPPSESALSATSWDDVANNAGDDSEIESATGRVARWTAQQAADGSSGSDWDEMDTDIENNPAAK